MAETSQTNEESLAAIIERAKQQLQHMIDLNPEGMLLVDAELIVTRANRAFLDLTGVTDFGSALGKRLDSLISFDDPEFAERLPAGKPGDDAMETEVGLAGGNKRIFRFTVVGSEAASGFWVLMVRDVTEEKQQALVREKTHKKEAAHQLTGALMHHMNQPLTVIMVTANLLKMELEKGEIDPEKLREGLEKIMSLATDTAKTLQMADEARDFVTEAYTDHLSIMDLEGSSGEKKDE